MAKASIDHRMVKNLVLEARKIRALDPNESLRLLKCANDLDNANYDVVSGIAQILAKGSASLEAMQWSQKAIAMSPSRPQAYNSLQRASSRAGFKTTEKFGVWAITVQPNNHLSHLFLAEFLRNAGRSEDSQQFYRATAVLLPVLGDPYLRLGGIQLVMDESDVALNSYRRAAAVGVQHPELTKGIALAQTTVQNRETRSRVKINRWPQNTKAFEDVGKIVRDCLPRLSPWNVAPLTSKSTVFTLGSCFAQNIAHVLNAQGVSTTYLPMSENFNSSGANLTFLRWILKDQRDSNFDRIKTLIETNAKNKLKNIISNCNVLVYTMGVSPAFFDRITGDHVIATGDAHAISLIRDCEFRTTTVSENVENLESIIALVREVNPNTHIVLSVSPIPLTATFEMDSAIIADCISKSIMRAATHEVISKGPINVSYWPSFEIVKWIAPHRQRSFGDDDGSSIHVNFDLLSCIFEQFIKYYSGDAIIIRETDREIFSNIKTRFSINKD